MKIIYAYILVLCNVEYPKKNGPKIYDVHASRGSSNLFGTIFCSTVHLLQVVSSDKYRILWRYFFWYIFS